MNYDLFDRACPPQWANLGRELTGNSNQIIIRRVEGIERGKTPGRSSNEVGGNKTARAMSSAVGGLVVVFYEGKVAEVAGRCWDASDYSWNKVAGGGLAE